MTQADIKIEKELKNILSHRWNSYDSNSVWQKLPYENKVADETHKWLLKNKNLKPYAFLLLSSDISPLAIENSCKKASEVSQLLKSNEAEAIIKPIFKSALNDMTFAVYPYYKPFSGKIFFRNIQRNFLRNQTSRWLEAALKQTISTPTQTEIEEFFIQPLLHISNNNLLPKHIRSSSQFMLTELYSENWKPYLSIMHNDLWQSNVLWAPLRITGGYGFKIIDWAGASSKGIPVYDFLRFSDSSKMNKKLTIKHLKKHARILNCRLEDLWGYLLAAIGLIGLNSFAIVPERHKQIVEEQYNYLNSILPYKASYCKTESKDNNLF